MKETAVEFLVDEFKEKLIGHNLPEWVEKIIEQAKAMEKVEKDKQYQRGFKDGSKHIKFIYNL